MKEKNTVILGTVTDKRAMFIGQEIRVGYQKDQSAQKSPACPDYFFWEEMTFAIAQIEREWKEFTRKGRATHNMRPAHHERAQKSGSWGVGRFYFRVLTECGRVFEIYYDRAPRNRENRQGKWFVYAEYI